MKFLCDRCKTRYSIADERVRGKILKIRCKNCSNVITVREGMPEPEPEAPAVAEVRRQKQPTDYMPAIMGAAPALRAPGPSPLQAAFAQAMEKPAPPPSQLEEEWYVSIDGDQSGPFTLAQAQDWVKERRGDDELYCWCEGFDDWLPIEKVSHFRGLRAKEKKARPAPPPPRAAAKEEEPKPLFAAALAALEAEVGEGTGNGARVDSRAETTPEAGAPRTRRPTAGEAAIAELRVADERSKPVSTAPPLAAAPMPAVKAQLPLPYRGKSPSTGPLLAKATPLTGTKKAPAGLFDESEVDSRVEDVPLRPASPSRPVPISLDQLAEQQRQGGAGNGKGAAAPALDDEEEEASDLADDNDFNIGEVSRVVRLNDVVAASRKPAGKKAPAPAARATAAVQAVMEAAAPASPLAEAALEQLHDEHHTGAGAPGEAAVLAPVAVPRKRRSHVPLFAVAGVLLVAVIGLVVFFATGDDDDGGASGGGGGDVENLALSADDPRYPRGTKGGSADTVTDPVTGGRKTGGGRKLGGGNNSGGNNGSGTDGTGPGTGKTEVVIGPDGQPLEPLTADDVITQALKMSTGTQRCYQRALKDDPFLKVTSIAALITISRDGKVTDVSLDKMQGQPLGQCLVAAIKRWPFRKSTAGLNTKITLKFEQTIN